MENTKDAYQQVSCGFVDKIEEHATLKKVGEIVYTEKGVIHRVSGQIVDRFTKEGAEFLKLADGTVVRLDRIVTLFGAPTEY